MFETCQRNGFPVMNYSLRFPAIRGNLEMFKYLYDEKFVFDIYRLCNFEYKEYICEKLDDSLFLPALEGDIEFMKYLYESGKVPTIISMKCRAKRGFLFIMQYLREINCPWDEYTCSAAVIGDNLECLKYLREHGCHWNEVTTYEAYHN